MANHDLTGDTEAAIGMIKELLGKANKSQAAIIANRLRRVLDDLSPKRGTVALPDTVEMMPEEQAASFARKVLTFKPYQDRTYGEVPRRYLEWLADKKRSDSRELRAFLMSPWAPKETDDEDTDYGD